MSTRSKKAIPRQRKQSEEQSNVLLHVMLLRQRPTEVEELWALLKGVTKWSLDNLVATLQTMERAGLARCDGIGWAVGLAFNPVDESNAADVAHQLIESYDKPRIVEKVAVRHDAIAEALAVRGRNPVSASELFYQLQGVSHQSLRMLQRDLVEMEKRGLTSRNDDGWMAGPELQDDRFESRAHAAAFKLLVSTFESAIPAEIQKSIKNELAKARKKLDSLSPEDPRNRWLEGIRIVPSHYELDEPIVDPDVKDLVEEAILNKKKIRLTGRYSVGAFDITSEFSSIGSISHYLLEFPGRPAVDFWPVEKDQPIRIRLEEIESAEPVNEAAFWPPGYEPVLISGGMTFTSKESKANNGKSLIVLRVSDDAMGQLKNRQLGRLWKVESAGSDGWTIVSFRARANIPLYQYLRNLSGVVVLHPFWFWKFASLDFRKAHSNYTNAIMLARHYMSEEEEAIHKPPPRTAT